MVRYSNLTNTLIALSLKLLRVQVRLFSRYNTKTPVIYLAIQRKTASNLYHMIDWEYLKCKRYRSKQFNLILAFIKRICINQEAYQQKFNSNWPKEQNSITSKYYCCTSLKDEKIITKFLTRFTKKCSRNSCYCWINIIQVSPQIDQWRKKQKTNETPLWLCDWMRTVKKNHNN